MMWLFAVLLVLALGAIAMVAAGRGAPMVEEYADHPDPEIPAAGDLTADDLRRVRFPLALRGYRMADVDALLDRLARQLDQGQDPATGPGDSPHRGRHTRSAGDRPSRSADGAADSG